MSEPRAGCGRTRDAAFVCMSRRQSFLDRFRFGFTDSHRPKPGTERTRMVEWREFPGIHMPTRAADCLDCDKPIVNAVGDVWGVRWHDSAAGEASEGGFRHV